MTGGAQDSGAVSDAVIEAMAKAHCDFFGGEGWWDTGLIADTQPKALEAMRVVVAAMLRATPAPAGWEPRIGEEVRVSEETAERWPDWRDTRLWVVGVSMDRNVSGTPTEGLNVCVSDEWPVTNRTGGFTDGFYINRPYAGDDLSPIPTAPAEGGV